MAESNLDQHPLKKHKHRPPPEAVDTHTSGPAFKPSQYSKLSKVSPCSPQDSAFSPS